MSKTKTKKKQGTGIQIAVGSHLGREPFEKFMTAKFNYFLNEKIPPERQREVINQLIVEGLIEPN